MSACGAASQTAARQPVWRDRRVRSVLASGAAIVGRPRGGRGRRRGPRDGRGLADASPAYLLAVVAVAVVRGTVPAIVTAIGAFLVYDFFFIEPLYTFTVRDPAEWLNLLLCWSSGSSSGDSPAGSATGPSRPSRGEREATRPVRHQLHPRLRTGRAGMPFGRIATILRDETPRAVSGSSVGETVAADTAGPSAPTPSRADRARRPAPAPRRRTGRVGPGPRAGARAGAGGQAIGGRPRTGSRSPAGQQTLGSIWATPADGTWATPIRARRGCSRPRPTSSAGSLERERLARDATTAEVSRRSDALKSALLDSVSHDLRTPLASIRAAAGTLMDPDIDWPPRRSDGRSRPRSIARPSGSIGSSRTCST